MFNTIIAYNFKESKRASKNETQYLFYKFTFSLYDNNHQTRFGMYIIAQQSISNNKKTHIKIIEKSIQRVTNV